MKLLMTASNAAEAEMICARLRAAGIGAIAQGGAFAASAAQLGACDIYVQEQDLAPAHEVLASAEGISEAELIQAETDAAEDAELDASDGADSPEPDTA